MPQPKSNLSQENYFLSGILHVSIIFEVHVLEGLVYTLLFSCAQNAPNLLGSFSILRNIFKNMFSVDGIFLQHNLLELLETQDLQPPVRLVVPRGGLADQATGRSSGGPSRNYYKIITVFNFAIKW